MRKGLRVGVLASGRGSDLQSLIDAHAANRILSRVVVVVSDNAEAKALQRARDHGLPAEAVLPPKDGTQETRRRRHEEAVAVVLERHKVELVVLAGYMRILSRFLVRRYAGRLINIHPGLLPSFPGTNAQKQALDRGVRIAGCTVHFLDEEVDHGPILLQAAVPVLAEDSADALSRRILEVEHELLPRSVHLIEQGRARVEGRRVRLDPDESWARKYPTQPGVLYGPGY